MKEVAALSSFPLWRSSDRQRPICKSASISPTNFNFKTFSLIIEPKAQLFFAMQIFGVGGRCCGRASLGFGCIDTIEL